MNQFCSKKRNREEDGNEELFPDPNENKKVKKLDISFPQENCDLSDFTSVDSNRDKNTSNKIDKNSVSTFESKNELITFNAKNAMLFKVTKYINPNQNNYNIKKIELEFDGIKEENITKIKSKSFILDINIKSELLSDSQSSLNSRNNSDYISSSHYSYSDEQDEFYPYEINEIIENQYKVS